jgi:hypothetical protein
MSSLSDRIAASTEARLSSVTGAVAILKAQLSELSELRERVRKAQGPNIEAERPSKTNTPSWHAFRKTSECSKKPSPG